MTAINPEMLFQTRSPRHSQQQTQNNIDLVRTVLMNKIKLTPEGIFPGDQLGLLYDQKDQKDIDQIRDILSNKLSYPSSQISELHMMANRLGTLDLKQQVGAWASHSDSAPDFKQISENAKFCPCCGFILQDSTLNICVDIQEINHIGVSTFLYFQTVKHLIVLLLVMFFVFVIYALASNVVASNNYRKAIGDQSIQSRLISFQGFLIISLGSKQLHESDDDKTSYVVQCWLGVAVVVLWGIMFAIIKQRERVLQVDVDSESKTASDYTLMIKNYPKHLTLQQFQADLIQHKSKIGKVFSLYESEPIKVAKINLAIPFYLNKQSFNDQQLKQANQEYEKYQQTFVQWILQRRDSPRFLTDQQHRKQVYKQFQNLKKKREQLYIQIAQKIKKSKIGNQQQETVPAFITFQNSYNKQFLQHLHDDDSIISRKFPCFDKSHLFRFKTNNGEQGPIAQIRQAPQPQDVIWTNLGQDSASILFKKIFTFTVTILVLAASFGAIYGLSKVQFDYSKTHTDSSNQYISILISLCISFINIIIQQIIRLLTKLQRDRTSTYHQASLGFKAVWALLINSILIPILVNWFFKENLYGVNGLAYDVFYLGITNSFLTPFLKIFDFYYYFTRALNWYKNDPKRRLYQNQNELNVVSEYMQFQIGYEYIYMVNLFLFTCFFVSLQPIIVVFAIVGLVIMYWAQKYSILNRCKRPAPGLNSINTTMYQMIYLGPAFYSIGSFCWSHFFKHNFIGIAPNLTAVILSGIIFLIPYKKIMKRLFGQNLVEPRIFQKDRIFLPSEYDRLNPATSQAGIKDYQNYLGQFKKQLKNKKPEQIKQIQRQFLRQFGLGARKNQPIMPRLGDIVTFDHGALFNSDKIVFQNLFGNNNNIMNPFVIGNTVLYDGGNENPMNMIVQNWMTDKEKQEIVTYDRQSGQWKGQGQGQGQGQGGGMFKMTDSVIKNNNNNNNNNTQGQIVTYDRGEQPLQISNNGQINIVYSLINNSTNNKGGNKLPPINDGRRSQEIPLNVPLNILSPLFAFQDPASTNNYNSYNNNMGNNYFPKNNVNGNNSDRYNTGTNNSNPFNAIMGNIHNNSNQANNGWYDPYQVNLFNQQTGHPINANPYAMTDTKPYTSTNNLNNDNYNNNNNNGW